MVRFSLRARLVAAVVSTTVALGIAAWIWQRFGGPRSSVEVTYEQDSTDEQPWRGQRPFVLDPVAGIRPRRSADFSHSMVALDSTVPETIVKHRDRHAFLRETELPEPLDRPAVLVVGDSHVDGVVSTADNFTSLLEVHLNRDGPPSYVLNAGCGQYSLWQSVLRARDLLPRFRPKVVVIVVFLGNDFLDLDNPMFPHLDDELHEWPPQELAMPETTSQRLSELAIPAPYEMAFWQGLNQALALHRNPARMPVLLAKAAHAIDSMQAAAAEHGANVLWVLLPCFDLVFPDRAVSFGNLAEEVVHGGAQRRLRDGFASLLAQRHAATVDLEPAFRADGHLSLYALDFHIFKRGHQRVAEGLYEPIVTALRR